jgi:hypothetical protein
LVGAGARCLGTLVPLSPRERETKIES